MEYPIVRAELVKGTGYESDHPAIKAFARLTQIADYEYNIVTGMVYMHAERESESVCESITCDFPASAEWIYKRCRDVVDICYSGDTITDIPFINE
jgi:hypothetical protein